MYLSRPIWDKMNLELKQTTTMSEQALVQNLNIPKVLISNLLTNVVSKS